MFLALSVQALGLRSFPLVACAITLAFEIVLRRLGVITQIVACGELLIALAGYAVITLGKAVRHIY